MKTIRVLDHTNHPIWSKVYKERFESLGKTNGAYTYSCDIVKFHIPVIEKVLKLRRQKKYKNILILTVGNIIDLDKNYLSGVDLVIRYLHEKIERELPRIEDEAKCLPGIKFIYFTSQYPVKEKLDSLGISCIQLPTSIDTEYVKQFKSKPIHGNRVIYFGNLYLDKDKTLNKIHSYFKCVKVKMDRISNNYFEYDSIFKSLRKRTKLTREQVLRKLSEYRYGIATGRAALEMYALGLKVIIAGEKIGGIITNDEEFELQKKYNFNSRVVNTFSDNIGECYFNISKSIVRSIDSKDVLPELEQKLLEEIKK